MFDAPYIWRNGALQANDMSCSRLARVCVLCMGVMQKIGIRIE